VYHLLSLSTPTRVGLGGSQTNLVIKDGLPQIFEEPGNLFVILDMVGEAAAVVLRCLRTCWKELSTKSEGEKKHTVLGHSAASVLPHRLDLFQNASPVRLYVREGFLYSLQWWRFPVDACQRGVSRGGVVNEPRDSHKRRGWPLGRS
jgi:hypothetical protein